MKLLSSDKELRGALLKGARTLCDYVAATLGPRGRTVLLQRKDAMPFVTKDGVTVAKFLDLENPFENMGAQILKQAAIETGNTAGDGTTTSTILAYGIFSEAQKYIAAGYAPIEIKKSLEAELAPIIKEITESAIPLETVEDVRHIATISANNDPTIGSLIAAAIEGVGRDGSVSIQEAKSMKTSVDFVEGFGFEAGYHTSHFINTPGKSATVYEDALLLVTDHKINLVEQIYPVLEIAARANKPLAIVSPEIEDQALAALILNQKKNTMRIVAIRAPAYGEERQQILEDLCVATGATFFSKLAEAHPRDAKLSDLGTCTKIEVLKNYTSIISGGGHPNTITERIERLKDEMRQTDAADDLNRLQKRITRLSSGVAVIRVGGATIQEVLEKRHRVEDALEAVKSAQEMGIVPGGGVALTRAVQKIESNSIGARILRDACEMPLRRMAYNAGLSADIILEKVKKANKNEGFDFISEKIVDMVQAGIIDPAKVAKVSLVNAVSAAIALITSDNAIVEISDNKEPTCERRTLT